jgi:hypothetical protein
VPVQCLPFVSFDHIQAASVHMLVIMSKLSECGFMPAFHSSVSQCTYLLLVCNPAGLVILGSIKLTIDSFPRIVFLHTIWAYMMLASLWVFPIISCRVSSSLALLGLEWVEVCSKYGF